jgi:hypothetical protein
MRTSILMLVAVVGVTATGLAVAASRGGTSQTAPVDLNAVSAKGTAVATPPRVDGSFAALTGWSVLAEHGRFVFFSAPSASGGDRCYGLGTVAGPAGLQCPFKTSHPDNAFPSSQRPILDMSPTVGLPGAAKLLTLSGFAADGVAHVALTEASGAVHDMPVEDNTYFDQTEVSDPTSLVAYDRNGREVYRQDYP